MNDDLDEFSHEDESEKDDAGEDTEYEDELIETKRKTAMVREAAQSSSLLSRVAGIQSRLTDPMAAKEIGEQSSGFETISPNRRMTKAVQPSKLFETSPIISATMNQRQRSSATLIMQPRNILAKKQNLPQEKQGDLIEVGVELETHFNNESNIGFAQEGGFHSVDRPSISINQSANRNDETAFQIR